MALVESLGLLVSLPPAFLVGWVDALALGDSDLNQTSLYLGRLPGTSYSWLSLAPFFRCDVIKGIPFASRINEHGHSRYHR
jgi:hypothetical protein